MPDNISKYNDSLTSSERSEQARKAGIESGRARRARADLLELSKSPGVVSYLAEHYNESVIKAMINAIIKAACRGNLSAIRFLVDLEEECYGYDPAEADYEPDINIYIVNDDEEVCDE